MGGAGSGSSAARGEPGAVLDKVLRSVDTSGADCHLVSHELEVITLSQMYGGGSGLRPEAPSPPSGGLGVCVTGRRAVSRSCT